jgi:hypothetical protein
MNSVNKSIAVMVKCGVLFEVPADFLNNIQTSFGFKKVKIHKITIKIMLLGRVFSCVVKFSYRSTLFFLPF